MVNPTSYILLILIALLSGLLIYALLLLKKNKRNYKSGTDSGAEFYPGKTADVQDSILFRLIAKGNLFSMELRQALRNITGAGAEILNCGRVSVWQYDDAYSVIRCLDLYIAEGSEHRSGDELESSAFPEYVKAHTSELLISVEDVFTDFRTKEIPARYFQENGISSLLDAPLWSNNRHCGVLSFEHTGKKRIWQHDDKRSVMILATLVSLCIENDVRNRTERELHEAEMQLRTAGDNLSGGMIYQVIAKSDGTRKFTYVSRGVIELYGLTPDQVIADSSLIYNQIAPEDAELISVREEESLKSMSPFDVEVRLCTKHGGIKWLRLFSHPRLMRSGEVIYDGLAMDITERKKYEAQLRESEENLRITLNSIGDAVISTDSKGRIVRMNLEAERLTGCNIGESRGRDFADIFRIKGCDGRDIDNPVKEIPVKGKTVFLEDALLLRKDGAELRIIDSAAPIINDAGGIDGAVIVFRDITEKYRLEQEARQNEVIFRTLFEASPYPIAINRFSDGIYVMVNPAFEKSTGFTEDELKGKNSSEIGFTENRDIFIAFKEQLERTGKLDNVSIKTNTKSGEKRYVIFSSRIITYNGERCMFSVIMDVTEIKRMQEQLNHSRKMDAVGQLAGGVAHDFNNMLGGILGTAELMQLHAGDDEIMKKYIRMIKTTAERAGSLTGKLMAFSRRTASEEISVDLHRIIEDAAELLGRTLDKKVCIKLNLYASNHIVLGDMSQLMNIFINLGINAGRAMPGGGELKFTTGNVDIDEEFCMHNAPELKPGRFIITEVQDNGCGIAPEFLGRIFEPFFTTREKGQGTGLGLASVYAGVRQHHGFVSVSSKPGEGTVFNLYLPLSEMAENGREPGPDIPRGKGVILVVDDEEIMRITAKELLQYLGYDVITAGNGKEGIDIFERENGRIDLVFLDMNMPIMNGKDCFSELKKMEPGVNVVLSSGFALEENINEMRMAGLAGFIRKPFQTAELGRVIAGALSGVKKK